MIDEVPADRARSIAVAHPLSDGRHLAVPRPHARRRAIRAVTNSPVDHVGMVVAIVLTCLALPWHAELGRPLPDVWSGESPARRSSCHLLRDAASAVATSATASARGSPLEVRGPRGRHEDRRCLGRSSTARTGRPFPTTLGLARSGVNVGAPGAASSLETIYCAEHVAHDLPAPWALLPHARRAGVVVRAAEASRSGAATGSSSSPPCRATAASVKVALTTPPVKAPARVARDVASGGCGRPRARPPARPRSRPSRPPSTRRRRRSPARRTSCRRRRARRCRSSCGASRGRRSWR